MVTLQLRRIWLCSAAAGMTIVSIPLARLCIAYGAHLAYRLCRYSQITQMPPMFSLWFQALLSEKPTVMALRM